MPRFALGFGWTTLGRADIRRSAGVPMAFSTHPDSRLRGNDGVGKRELRGRNREWRGWKLGIAGEKLGIAGEKLGIAARQSSISVNINAL